MEKIEVAVRLRPLYCNPAENISEYPSLDIKTPYIERQESVDHIWRIEDDQKTLRFIPQQSNSNKNNGASHHSHNKSFGNVSSNAYQQLNSNGLSRQTSVGKISNQIPRGHHHNREDNKSLGGFSRHQQFQTRPQTPIGKWERSTPQSSKHQSNLQNQIKQMKSSQTFRFDQCFGNNVQNETIYEQLVKRVTLSALQGINGTVFVYGQTGSGKTYTMLGKERMQRVLSQTTRRRLLFDDQQDEPGILIHALHDLFEEIEKDENRNYFLRCAYVEIYNEQVYDLLRLDPSSINEALQLVEDNKSKDFFVRGVTEEAIHTLQDIMELLNRGEMNRHYAETKLNHQSSRSHTVFRVWLQSVTKDEAATLESLSDAGQQFIGRQVTSSVLNFVDLAGSEKLSSHYNGQDELKIFESMADQMINRYDPRVKDRIIEGKNINKSLFFLTQVIQMRAQQQRQKRNMSRERLNYSSSPFKNSNSAGSHNVSQSFASSNVTSTIQVSETHGTINYNQNSNSHIPYRNSPLTKLLKNSLCGNSRTCIVICITPTPTQVDQSLSSLRFGQSAMKVENKVKPNVVQNTDEEAVKLLIADYERRIRNIEKDRREQLAQREYEARLLKQLLEERNQWQNQTNQRRNGQFERVDTARIISKLEKSKTDQVNHDYRGQECLIVMDNIGVLQIPEALREKYRMQVQRDSLMQMPEQETNISQAIFEKMRQQHLMHQEHADSLYECINVLKHQNLKLEQQLRDASFVIQDRKHKVLSCQIALMKENYQLKAKERFYEGFNREYIKGMDLDTIRALERRMSGVQELLKTEIAYRERVERIQNQLTDMITHNNEGKNVLEKALDLLNESHEEECDAIKNDIEQSFHSNNKDEGSNWTSDQIMKRQSIELPNEIQTLDEVHESIKNVVRDCSISHSLDPSKQEQIHKEEQTAFERIESTIRERESLVQAYSLHLEEIKEQFERNDLQAVQESLNGSVIIETQRTHHSMMRRSIDPRMSLLSSQQKSRLMSPSNQACIIKLDDEVQRRESCYDITSTVSSNLVNFQRGLNNMSPGNEGGMNHHPNHVNDETNFLKTGDNQNGEYANLAGHVTNFVDNEASLDFLSTSHAQLVNDIQAQAANQNNFSLLMRELDQESNQTMHRQRKSSFQQRTMGGDDQQREVSHPQILVRPPIVQSRTANQNSTKNLLLIPPSTNENTDSESFHDFDGPIDIVLADKRAQFAVKSNVIEEEFKNFNSCQLKKQKQQQHRQEKTDSDSDFPQFISRQQDSAIKLWPPSFRGTAIESHRNLPKSARLGKQSLSPVFQRTTTTTALGLQSKYNTVQQQQSTSMTPNCKKIALRPLEQLVATATSVKNSNFKIQGKNPACFEVEKASNVFLSPPSQYSQQHHPYQNYQQKAILPKMPFQNNNMMTIESSKHKSPNIRTNSQNTYYNTRGQQQQQHMIIHQQQPLQERQLNINIVSNKKPILIQTQKSLPKQVASSSQLSGSSGSVSNTSAGSLTQEKGQQQQQYSHQKTTSSVKTYQPLQLKSRNSNGIPNTTTTTTQNMIVVNAVSANSAQKSNIENNETRNIKRQLEQQQQRSQERKWMVIQGMNGGIGSSLPAARQQYN